MLFPRAISLIRPYKHVLSRWKKKNNRGTSCIPTYTHTIFTVRTRTNLMLQNMPLYYNTRERNGVTNSILHRKRSRA